LVRGQAEMEAIEDWWAVSTSMAADRGRSSRGRYHRTN
jgi:hypothetical protein